MVVYGDAAYIYGDDASIYGIVAPICDVDTSIYGDFASSSGCLVLLTGSVPPCAASLSLFVLMECLFMLVLLSFPMVV